MMSKYFRFAIVAVMLLKTVNSAYLSTKCGYHGSDYSIKWAFEPKTQSIVFVLKTMPPRNLSSEGMLVTGVTFGTEKHREFIGVGISKQNVNEMKVIGAKAEGMNGPFEMNSDDTMSKVREITLKRRQNGEIIAEFARPLKGEKERELFTGCKTFQFPIKWTWIPSGSSTFAPVTKQREICELAQNCLLDVQELKKKIKHRDASFPVDIAHSVDVSGKGDPCSFKNENYHVRWVYDSETTSVNFVLRQKAKSGKWWSAVGIGDNMSDMDIGIVFLDDGEPDQMGDYYSNSYGTPEKDANQDWKLNKSESKWDDASVELHFSRQLITKDAKDRSLDGCVLFQFASNGGTYGEGNKIHKHENWPDLYKACDLKKYCAKLNGESNDENFGQINVDRTEISHSNDGTNGSRLNNIVRKEQPQNKDKANSLSTQNLGLNISESENKGQSPNNKVNETKSLRENEQRENAQTQNENKEKSVELKPLKKRQGESGTENANAEINYGEASGNKTSVGEIFTAEETAKNDTVNERSIGGSGGESPFSLNAFLGNQTESSIFLPVGESLTQNGTKEGEIAKFGIGQLIGDDEKESNNGTSAGNEMAKSILLANETAELKNETTVANSTLMNGEITAEKENSNSNEALNATIISMNNNNSTSAEDKNTTIGGPSNTIPKTEDNDEHKSAAEESDNLQNNKTTTTINLENESISNETNASEFAKINAPINNGTTQTEEIGSKNEHNSTETTDAMKEETSAALTNTMEVNTTMMTTMTTVQSLAPNNTVIVEQQPTPAENDTTETENGTTASENDITKAENGSTENPHETTTETTTVLTSTANGTILEEEKNITKVANEHEKSNGTEETTATTQSSSAPTTNANATVVGETDGPNEQTKEGQQNGTKIIPSSNIERGNGGEQIIKLPVARSKCETLRPDLPVCKSYMDNYLGRVREWADKHGEPMEQQYGKACKLLAAVPHVPTLCCQIFAENCTGHL